MIVLSLFDGISCGQLALKRAGINPNVYFTKSFGTGIFTSKEDRDYIKNKLEENSYFKDEELEHKIIRPLTCTECERLQTLPDGYTACIKSEIKRKEAIGNAWTVDVITHILKGITNETINK